MTTARPTAKGAGPAGLRASSPIDLHAHTDASDGTEPAAVLVARAAAVGVRVLAVTDHDTTRAWSAALAAGRQHQVHVVPGIEMSAVLDGASVHVLGYWPDPDDPELRSTLERLHGSRTERAQQTLLVLAEHGIEVPMADVVRAAGPGTPIGRPHLADALVAAGVVTDRAAAFEAWLGVGRPAHVPKPSPPSVAEVVRVLRSSGGVPVLAHPWGRESRAVLDESTLAALAACGLVGLEVDHGAHDERDRRELSAIAHNLGLLVTGGSDDHGPGGKADTALGSHGTTEAVYRRLREQAVDPSARESGV